MYFPGPILFLVILLLIQTVCSLPTTIPNLIVQLDNAFEVQEAKDALQEFYSRSGLPNVTPEVIQVGNFYAMVVPSGDSQFMSDLNKLGPVRSVENEEEWSFAQTPTNLARIQQRNGSLNTQLEFEIAGNAGQGVDIYIVDSGCNVNHPDLIGRSRIVNAMDPGNTEPTADILGHGTHVSATAAGKTFGIARGANIICIKIMNSQGVYTGGAILRGLAMVSTASKDNPKQKIVVNLSLTGPGNGSSAVSLAVNALVDLGVGVAVAAGNGSTDACNFSPASAVSAMTIGAMEVATNKVADVSNFGSCVDLFAPGINILSADKDGGQRVLSGTSMAAPHVAGALAVLMAQDLSFAQASKRLLDMATKNSLTGNLRGSPNLMLFLDPNQTAQKGNNNPVSVDPPPARTNPPPAARSPPPVINNPLPVTRNPPTPADNNSPTGSPPCDPNSLKSRFPKLASLILSVYNSMFPKSVSNASNS